MIKALRTLAKYSSVRDKIKLERESRLNKGKDSFTLTTKTIDQIYKIRNIGIIAHIDAGKTTTTERMLYYAGALPSPGNIDEGTTTMDFLAQQRQRGITIRSAAISFNWLDNQINLIDTPGHIDFSGEVTRSLQVLDGAVTIFDGVKGVENQTKKVWDHASKFMLPKICYINKMDRIGASVVQTAQSIRNRLKTEPLIMQYPIGECEKLKGVIDLCSMEEITFGGEYGETIEKTILESNTQKHNIMLEERKKIIEIVGNYDEKIAQMYLNEQFVPPGILKKAIRNILLSEKHYDAISPVFLGTSFRNKGVQPLLDAVVSFLPSPAERKPIHSFEDEKLTRSPKKEQKFTGYVFKILHDLEKGALAFTRIYSGSLKKSNDIYNSNKKSIEKISHILRVRANQYIPIQDVSAGDIIALSGLKETAAGQTLTLSMDDPFVFAPLDTPEPIFTVPFSVQQSQKEKDFFSMMKKAILEDNTLTFKHQIETNQYLVSGLGELHLEILKDRMIEQGIPVKMGNLKINFKETVASMIEDSIHQKIQIKEGLFEEIQMKVRIQPLRSSSEQIVDKNIVSFEFDRVKFFDVNWKRFLERKKSKVKTIKKGEKIPRNPTPIEPLRTESNEEDLEMDMELYEEISKKEDSQKKQKKEEQIYYHINTLPFEILYELYEICLTSIAYGKHNLPTMGIQLQILDGKYKKNSFSTSFMKKKTVKLVRDLMTRSSTIIEPMMTFTITGQEEYLQMIESDILKKRGRIEDRDLNIISGVIPAEGVKGWIKKLRSMGVEAEFKFCRFEEIMGISEQKLLQSNE